MSLRRAAAALATVATLAAWVPATAHAQAYEIPPDNPFVGTPGARPEIYAYGMRNPYRWSFDRLTGDMYVGDVGGSAREEVTYLPRASSAGANLGWNCHEGDVAGPGNCTAPGHRPPQYVYPETGDPVIGGYVVRDATLGSFQGRYLVGRYGGTVSSLAVGAGGSPQATGLSIPQLTSFGEDGLGRLYATSQAGPVYRLTASGGTLGIQSIGTFDAPSAIAAPPGNPNLLFIAELGGKVRLRANGQVFDFIDLDPVVQTGGEQGLLAVAPAPDYTTSGRVFVYYTANGGDLTLDEVRRSPGDPNRADPASRRNVLTIEHSGAANHNGGQLLFGPDGYLYLSTGDGGGQGDPERDAQSLRSLLGKILRLDLDVATPPAPVAVAPDRTAPSLRVRVKRRQRLLRLRGAVARVRCNEACAVRAAGVLRIGKRRFRLRSATRRAQAAQATRRVRLKVRLKPRSRRALRRAMRRGRRPLVRVGLRATDTAGNSSRIVYRKVRARR
jgi:glucose/arabinose dehydrogenase